MDVKDALIIAALNSIDKGAESKGVYPLGSGRVGAIRGSGKGCAVKRGRWSVMVGSIGAGLVVLVAAAPAVAVPVSMTGSTPLDSHSRAGYSTYQRHVVTVGATWTQPTANCSSTTDSRATIEVALERPGYHDAIMIGTEIDCVRGQPSYYAWWKEPMGSREILSRDVQAGDTISATAYIDLRFGHAGADIEDERSFSIGISGLSGMHGFARASGAVLVRAVKHKVTDRLWPLTDFGTVYFSQATAGDDSIAAGDTADWRMVNATGGVRAIPSGLHEDGSFAVNWRSAR